MDAVAAGMAPDPEQLSARLAFLQIGERDLALLKRVHARLEQERGAVVDAFYAHLDEVPALRTLLGDEHARARLREVQGAYFSSLSGDPIDEAYVHHRLRVGLAHQRIGLAPQWYIGAYRTYLAELWPVLNEVLADRPQQIWPTFDALLKRVCFDLGLALDAYIESGRRQLESLKNYSEHIIGGMSSGVLVLDRRRAVRTMNLAFRAMLDIGEHEPVQGQPYVRFVQHALLRDCIELGLADPGYQQELLLSVEQGRAPRHLRCKLSRCVLDGDGYLMVMMEDVTALLRARADLRDSEERFRVAFGQAAVGLAQLGADGCWLRTNRKLQSILGYGEHELARMTLADLTSPEEHEDEARQLRGLLDGSVPSYSREARYRHKDGGMVWVQASFSPMHTGDGQASLIAVIEDIAPRKRFELELIKLANQDGLTGLANRNLLLDRLSQAISHARRAGRWVGLLFVDLDRFKNINDSLGHDAGDHVLMEVGRRLEHSVRQGDTVARLGGDEFVVLLSDVARSDDVASLGQKVRDALEAPFIVFGHEVAPVASIGISLYPRDGADAASLLKNADAAMYRAKRLGGDSFQFYAQDMNARTLDRLKLEAALRHALERGEFHLVYQPQLDLASGQIVGVEALVRWQPPHRPLVMPGEFIPVAEETGLIVPLGAWVLRTACAQQAAWERAGLRSVRMAVNLSARQFKQQDLVQTVSDALHASGCDPRKLELEITESVLMENPDAATAVMQQLADMGIQLSIDDFGSGYSSLSYLKRFPIHSLKIDRSFVHDIPNDSDDAAIASAVIALAHSMRLKVTAEGVEGPAQLDFLRAQRCDQIQGYCFSKPKLAKDLAVLLEPDCGGQAA
ncbi:EAL domain-containing protein [Oxalobacteraceae bacterium A2-2]